MKTLLEVAEQEFVDQVVARHEGRPGALLSILEQVQERNPHKYLSRDVLDYIAAKTEIPRAQIYSVVTFYALFNLEPQGEHRICICRGTACHTRGIARTAGAVEAGTRTGPPERGRRGG